MPSVGLNVTNITVSGKAPTVSQTTNPAAGRAQYVADPRYFSMPWLFGKPYDGYSLLREQMDAEERKRRKKSEQ